MERDREDSEMISRKKEDDGQKVMIHNSAVVRKNQIRRIMPSIVI